MQQARNPQAYGIPLSGLSDEEAESWRLVQRSAWGVRDTTGPGWQNVGEGYTSNVRFVERKDDALAELDKQIKLMGILSHATVDLGTSANDEVRKVLTDNCLDFLLRGMPFEMAQMPGQLGQSGKFGTWGMPEPPKTDYWMFNQDPIFGTGWRAQPDFYQTLTLLGRQREIGPARDPHQLGINPAAFGMTQGDVIQGYEDIRERAGAIEGILQAQRDQLADMSTLDWQGKMLDWRPMLLWGMLLDPFDWYARGMEAAGYGNKAFRAATERFNIAGLSNADAVENIRVGRRGWGRSARASGAAS